MSEARRGDVVLVRFPFTDLRAAKLRPAVVLALHTDDIVVAGIFSNVPSAPKESWLVIDERNPHFVKTGLRRPSVVKGEKVAILHRSIVHSVIGSLHPTLFDAVCQCVKAALQLP